MSPSDAVDPRVARSRRAVHEATLGELGEVGYGAMTIESVAARASVGKATIYRHWNGKLDLIESALGELKADIVVPETGTIRERIAAFLDAVTTETGNSTLAGCLPALVSAARYDPAVSAFMQRFHLEQRRKLVDLVVAGIESGDITVSGDPAFLAEMLVSPIFFRRLVAQRSPDAAQIDAVIALVLG